MSKIGGRMEVRWHDAVMDNGTWEPLREARKGRFGTMCHSIGFVLVDDKVGVTLASTVNGHSAAGVVHIPAGMIVSRRRLRS